MRYRAVIEEAIGETRAAIYEGRRLAELYLRRHTHDIPQTGDTYTGQVITVDPSVAGAFVDLGGGHQGLLKFSGQKELPKLTDGLLIDVRIAKAAIAEKGALLTYLAPGSKAKAGLIARPSLQDYLTTVYPSLEIEYAPVSVFDTVCERAVNLKSGGTVYFDQTQALLAIDVDKGRADRVLDACLEAAQVIASQLRLRGLGGLVVIDFPNLRQPKQRTSLLKNLEKAFEGDPAAVKIAPLSRFGVIEMTRSQPGPSLDAKLNDRFGEPTIETQALRALRRLEREANLSNGAQLELFVPEAVKDWLDTTEFDWEPRLTKRIGPRFKITLGKAVDVRADR